VIIFKATRRLSEQSAHKHPQLVDLAARPPGPDKPGPTDSTPR
jgi:hypothetical protein